MAIKISDPSLQLLRITAAVLLYSNGANHGQIARVLHIHKSEVGKLLLGVKKKKEEK